MKYQLSIVIPAKNEKAYIGKCLEALRLSAEKWDGSVDVTVVDNSSNDGTDEIAKNFGCKVIRIAGGTVAKLRNAGCEEAIGDFVGFIDADCEVDPMWISICMKKMEDQKIVAVGTRAVPSSSTWVERAVYRVFCGSERPDYVEWLGTSNLIIRRKIFLETGGFKEHLTSAEDVELCRRLKKKGYIYLEKKINTIHLRESKFLYDLFRREIARGSRSLRVLFYELFSAKDLISCLAFIANLVLYFVFCSFFVTYFIFSLIAGLGIICIPLVLLMYKRPRWFGLMELIENYIVAFIYVQARSIAIGKEVIELFGPKSEKINSQ